MEKTTHNLSKKNQKNVSREIAGKYQELVGCWAGVRFVFWSFWVGYSSCVFWIFFECGTILVIQRPGFHNCRLSFRTERQVFPLGVCVLRL